MLRVRKIEHGSPRQMLRAIPGHMRRAGTETVGLWHRQMMPGHFELSATRKYGYQPRKGDNEPPYLMRPNSKGVPRRVINKAYSWEKRRRMGHNRPLVYTGQSEQDAKSKVRFTARLIRADQIVRSAAVMNLPRYFYQYRKDHNAPNKVDELLRTIPAEESVLEAFFANRLERGLNDLHSMPQTSTQIA